MKLASYSFALFVSIVLFSCNDPDAPSAEEDRDLIALLESRTANKSLEDLTFPSSNAYSQLPQDPNNPITQEKIDLGKLLFHETALALKAKNNVSYLTYSCASCHHVDAGFQSGNKQGLADGGEGFGIRGEARRKVVICPDELCDVQPVKSPTVLNSAYQTNQLWNGQFGAGFLNAGTEDKWVYGTPLEANKLGYQGVETQAIAGFSVHRMGIDTALLTSEPYKSYFLNAFPQITDLSILTEEEWIEYIGLAVAAYERILVADQSPYQRWLKGENDALTANQKEGMRLFFDKAECYACHNGPALNTMEFYALGFNDFDGVGVIPVADNNASKGRGGFTGKAEDDYKFKVPQLYNLKDAGFFGHGASFTSIEDVIEYKDKAIPENAVVPSNQLASNFKPLNLTIEEKAQLLDFIENGLYDAELNRYVPSAIPSGYCFPNNDSLSKIDICQ